MKVFIIAEAGVNHNGRSNLAIELIDAAAKAGADAVKFQTFKAERLVSRFAPKAEYQKKTTDERETQLEMLGRLEFDLPTHELLFRHCAEKGIEFISTPFDVESLELLLRLRLSRIKIPSGEITNAPLLLRIAQAGFPVIMSTGMATLGEIEDALAVLAFGFLGSKEQPSSKLFHKAFCTNDGQKVLKEKVTLMHCTTEYPAPVEDVNLKAMLSMREAFGLPVGYSDHTSGIAVSIASAVIGATIIEKHFTIDKNLPGPDHKASLEPGELAEMIRSIRQVEAAMGSGIKYPAESELKNRNIARKSLVASSEISTGEQFSSKNITCKRPGTGISPMQYWDWIGKVAERNYIKDDILTV